MRYFVPALVAVSFFAPSSLPAAVTTDGSMGGAGALAGPNYAITANLGRQVGSNLFHSFSRFDLATGESAVFSGPASVANIISRVTGGTQSTINGTIRSDIAGANLYLLNPAGVVFGANASLNVSGSFHAATADYLQLGAAGRFAAAIGGTSSLTVDPPSAFGFLASAPAPIAVSGSLLTVGAGKTISLVAGGITLTDGNLWANSGTVNVISVASTGSVMFDGLNMSPQGFSRLGPVIMTEARDPFVQPFYNTPGIPLDMLGLRTANIDASGAGGGRIVIRGGSFLLQGGTVYNDTYGNAPAASTNIALDGAVQIQNASVTGNAMSGTAPGAALSISGGNLLFNGAIVNTDALSGGNGSDIALKATGDITVSGTSLVSSDANGGGRAGNLAIEATNITIGKGSRISSSAPILGGTQSTGAGAVSLTAANSLLLSGELRSDTGEGSSGNITVKAKDLTMSETGLISTSLLSNPTATPRKSGDIAITANTLTMNDDARIESRAFYSNSGSSGTISVDAGTVILRGGAAISASIDSLLGSGGNIRVTASDSILISSRPTNLLKEKGSVASDSTAGDAGHITLQARRIDINNGATVSTIARGGSGKGGDITLSASDEVRVQGFAVKASSIETDTLKDGNAGNIRVTAPRVTISDGGLVSSAALAGSTGRGGNILLQGQSLLTVSGQTSRVTADTYGRGDAGSIWLGGRGVDIVDGAVVTTTAQQTSFGRGGNITVEAGDTVRLSATTNGQGGRISAETFGQGDAGSITVDGVSVEIGNGGFITTSARPGSSGRGGNITVRGDTVKVAGSAAGQASRVTAETFGPGDAGVIAVEARTISLLDGGTLSAATQSGSTGNGGGISVTARESLTIAGPIAGGIFGNTLGSGKGASLTISSPLVEVRDAGFISADTGAGSTGAGGGITVTAGQVRLAASSPGGSGARGGSLSTLTRGSGNAGTVTVNADDLKVQDGGVISTSAASGSSGNAGSIALAAKGAVLVAGSFAGQANQGSEISSSTSGAGNAGSVTIAARSVEVGGGGIVTTSAKAGSTGRGGNISVKAEQGITVAGAASGPAGRMTAETYGRGDAGTIAVEARTVSLLNGGAISAAAQAGSTGNGGGIVVKAGESLTIAGPATGGILGNALGSGKGASIQVTSPRIDLADGGYISADTGVGSSGDGGSIGIKSGRVTLAGSSAGNGALGGRISTVTRGSGNAGSVALELDQLKVLDGGIISTSATSGSGGNAGSVAITATQTVVVAGYAERDGIGQHSEISSSTSGTGNAGSISISASSLEVRDGGIITTSAEPGSTGAGGNITIKVEEAVAVSALPGAQEYQQSYIAGDTHGPGKGGTIELAADRVNLDGGAVQTRTFGSGIAGDITTTARVINLMRGARIDSSSKTAAVKAVSPVTRPSGAAGSLRVEAAELLSVHESSITTQSAASNGGNIVIVSPGVLDVTRGEITATATGGSGNGGNVTIDAGRFILKGGRLTAQADRGDGGNLDVRAELFIKSGDSLVSASSRYGAQGTVTIQAPVIDVDAVLAAPVFAFANLDAFLPKRCVGPGELNSSSFRLVGGDGLPAAPENSFPLIVTARDDSDHSQLPISKNGDQK